jgi:hypothetical protein
VYGYAPSGYGVYGKGRWCGVYAETLLPPDGQAGRFLGSVYISGTLTNPGGGSGIDHPLDPANKYLHHSFVESPDMKNIYDGVVVLNAKGEAVVKLPTWFGALNKDFRYQLTPIGAPGPNLYITLRRKSKIIISRLPEANLR